MADNSKIEWTDATWNPIRARNRKTGKVGWHCEKVSPAWTHCYAAAQNEAGRFFGTQLPYTAASLADAEPFLDEQTLLQPLRWKRPRRIFVCSMTDLFGHWVPDAWIDQVFAAMAMCERHTFQVLTKRHERMHAYLAGWPMDSEKPDRITEAAFQLGVKIFRGYQYTGGLCERPLPNVHLGVTVEDQERAELRIPFLLRTPAAVRFVSVEPLLGPVRFDPTWLVDYEIGQPEPRLNWIIVGGESGKEARPMHPDWARSLRDQCLAASVPFFFKQWGEWKPISEMAEAEYDVLYEPPPARYPDSTRRCRVPTRAIAYDEGERWAWSAGGKPTYQTFRVGKKAAGRVLDGREWNELPATAAEVAHA